VAVVNYPEVLFFGFGVLQFLDVIVFKLDNFPTANADKVVMMLSALTPFIQLFPIAKVLLLKDFAFFKKRECPINGGFRNSSIGFLGEGKKLLSGEMTTRLKRLMKNCLSLAGELEIFFFKEFRK